MLDFADISNIGVYYELSKDGNILKVGNIPRS